MKYDIGYQKNELKRLAQLRVKLDIERFSMIEKLLPEFEDICLDWFHKVKNSEVEEIQDRIYSS